MCGRVNMPQQQESDDQKNPAPEVFCQLGPISKIYESHILDPFASLSQHHFLSHHPALVTFSHKTNSLSYCKMPKTFLILGAGMTGIPLAHYVLKHYSAKHDLKVILVSRSDEFYWNIGAP